MGITRDSILQLAVAEGFRVEVGTITVDDLSNADEAFLCGTACEVLPVSELDGRQIGRFAPGPATEQIRKAYDCAKIGSAPQWRHWLHPVGRVEAGAGTAASK